MSAGSTNGPSQGPSKGPSSEWRDMEVSELVHKVVPSPNCNTRKLPITMLVIHYTEMKPVETALARLTDPEAGVSAHYLISEGGEVMQLVSERERAWHAGASYWRGIKDVNSASIGIELDHPGHAEENGGYRPFTEEQFAALVPLAARIVKDHDIPRANVVGHSDVAPMRKIDPGRAVPVGALGRIRPMPASTDQVRLRRPLPQSGCLHPRA